MVDPKTESKARIYVRIGPRDLNLFAYLYENRFATDRRVAERFWKNPSSRTHARRLRALVRFGFIDKVVVEESSGKIVYRLTQKGISELKREGRLMNVALGTRHIRRETFRHDDLVQDLREIFERSPLVSNFKSEHLVRSELAKTRGVQPESDCLYKVPDAIFSLRVQGREFRVALELELSRKGKARMERLMRLLCTSSDFDIVFFVANDKPLLGFIERTLKQLRADDLVVKTHTPEKGFYFANLADLLSEQAKAKFHGEGTTFTLETLGLPIE